MVKVKITETRVEGLGGSAIWSKVLYVDEDAVPAGAVEVADDVAEHDWKPEGEN